MSKIRVKILPVRVLGCWVEIRAKPIKIRDLDSLCSLQLFKILENIGNKIYEFTKNWSK